MSIEFTDYAVSQALYSVIDGWVNSLPKRQTSALYAFFNKTEKSIRLYSGSIMRFIVLVSGAYAAFHAHTVREAFFITLVFFGISVLLPTFTDAFIEKGYESFALSRPITNLLVTIGDQDRLITIGKKQKMMVSSARFMFFGVLLTLLLGLFSNYIYDILKSKII